MNTEQTRRLLERISAAYGRKPHTPVTIDEWQRAMTDTNVHDANAALDRWIREKKPGPCLAEILAYLPRKIPEDLHPEPRYEPDDAERGRVKLIQERIAANLAQHTHRRR